MPDRLGSITVTIHPSRAGAAAYARVVLWGLKDRTYASTYGESITLDVSGDGTARELLEALTGALLRRWGQPDAGERQVNQE